MDGDKDDQDGSWIQDPKNPLHSYRYIKEYFPDGVARRIGGGNSSCIGMLADGSVLKYPLVKGEGTHRFEVEKAIYEALGNHKRIVRYLGSTPDGIKLELATGGSVSSCLNVEPLSPALRLQWCRQAAEGLAYIHTKGVIHCDLHTNNLLLNSKFDVLLSDFQGTFQGMDGFAMESIRYFLPREPESPPNRITDIFALGTLMYTIMTGHEPYNENSDEQVEEYYKRQEFPDVLRIRCSATILRCWKGEYSDARWVVHDLVSLEIQDK